MLLMWHSRYSDLGVGGASHLQRGRGDMRGGIGAYFQQEYTPIRSESIVHYTVFFFTWPCSWSGKGYWEDWHGA